MGQDEDRPGSPSDTIVEYGETYDHVEHDAVEVTGIWRGIERVDEARFANERDVIIVRYSTDQDGEPVDELTDTLDDFLDAIE